MTASDGVVYQVYPRSFQDSDGDGVGDLAGIERRLHHVATLGASALLEFLPSHPDVLAYARGKHLVAVNTSAEPRPAPGCGELVLATHEGALEEETLAPHAAVVLLLHSAG